MSERVCVYGLWHLGSVTAAGLAANGFEVIGLDRDAERISSLREGTPPVSEPDLAELVQQGIRAGKLSFSAEPETALQTSSVLWVAFDTPVDAQDDADIDWLMAQLEVVRPHLRPGAIVVIASQVPVGFTNELATRWLADDPSLVFACAPENLRLGSAIADFLRTEHIVVGLDTRREEDRQRVRNLFAAWGDGVLWTTIASAEMSKHALNAFLAVSVAYANEVGRLCEQVGADATAVATWLRSDPRIGRRAYVAPGPPIAGGTLLRDVGYLTALGQRSRTSVPVLSAISASNDVHQAWAEQHLERMLRGVDGAALAVLGLTYKPGTDTLRRSSSLTLGVSMADRGVRVSAFDPAITRLPPDADRIHLAPSIEQALEGADAVLLATAWPEFRAITADQIVSRMRQPRVVDQHGLLKHLGDDARIEYITVGRSSAKGSTTS